MVALDEIIKQVKGEVMIGNKVSRHKFGTFKAANIKNSDYLWAVKKIKNLIFESLTP